MVPVALLPPAIPFTLHMTAVEGLPEPVTVAVNTCAAPAETVAELGEIASGMLSVSVSVAEPVAVASSTLAAWIVIAVLEGRTAGAVYRPAVVIVPIVEFPAAIPLTLQSRPVFEVPPTAA